MNDDYFRYIVKLGETLRGFSKWSEMYQQQINALKLASTLQSLRE